MWINYEEIRRKADQIRELCGDDEDTFLDTLDGECDAMDILGGLLTLREETKQNEKMNKELAATYKQRAERANNKQDATNILIKQLLIIAARQMKLVFCARVYHPPFTPGEDKSICFWVFW